MKQFDEWNTRKQSLQNNGKPYIKFHARDVWWCSYGVNIRNLIIKSYMKRVLVMTKTKIPTVLVGNFVMPVFSLGKPYPRKGFRPQA